MSSDARLTYRRNAAEGATALGLVILLYEQAIEDLRKASVELEAGRVEERTNAINHALLVIGHLQSSLDLGQGGQAGGKLEQFYNFLRVQLCRAQAEGSSAKLRELTDALVLVKGAWLDIEKLQQPPAGSGDTEIPSRPAPASGSDWRA